MASVLCSPWGVTSGSPSGAVVQLVRVRVRVRVMVRGRVRLRVRVPSQLDLTRILS